MGENDDLTLEITGSAKSADKAFNGLIKKVTEFQAAIEKVTPSLSKFTEKLGSITAGSKAFAMLDKLTKGTGNLAEASKKAEANEAMYQARIDRAGVSMERSKVQSEKLASALTKVSEAERMVAHNNAAFSMPASDFAKKFNTSRDSQGVNLTPEQPGETYAPTVAGHSKLASEILPNEKSANKSIHFDTSQAQSSIEKVQAFINRLTPSISHMSSDAQMQFNAIAAKLNLVSQRIDNQRMLYRSLADQAARVAQEQGRGSTAYLQMEKRMLAADSAAQRLSETQEKLKTELADVTSANSKVGTGMTNAGNKAESAAKKSTNGFGKLLQMVGRMAIYMVAFKVFSIVTSGITTGIQDMAQASSQANQAMSALTTSSLYLKNSFAAALMPAIQALTPAITWLIDRIASLFNMIGMLGARIFGGATTVTVAKSAQVNYAATLDKTGDSASKTNKKVKELQRTVMGFDELNKLSKPTESSTPKSSKDKNPGIPSVGSMFENVKIPAGISALGDKVKDFLKEWAEYAQPTVAAFQRLTKALEPLKTFAAKGLEDFYNDLLKPLGKWVLGKGLPEFLDITTRLLKNINWSQLNKALDDLWKALEPFAQNIGEGLLWFYDKVIEPIEEWALNTAIPKALKIIATVIDIVNQVIENAKPALQWFYNEFLVPLGKWTGGLVSDDLDLIGDSLKTLDDLLKGDTKSAAQDGQKALNDLGKVIKDLTGIDIPGAIKDIKDKIEELHKWWDSTVVPWFSKEKWIELFNQANLAAQDKWNEISNWWKSSTLVKWWSNDVAPWFTKEKWANLYVNVKQSLVDKWDETIAWWNSQGPVKWWSANVSPWFTKEKWAGLYANIKLSLADAWNGAVSWWNSLGPVKWWKNNVQPWFTAKKWQDLGQQAIDGIIKPFKNIHWPKISTPHIEWTSGGWQATGWIQQTLSALHLPTQMPKLNVNWYAKGGLFDTPSIIGVGEAGPEAALPLNDKVFSQIATGIIKSSGAIGSDNGTDQIIDRLDRLEESLQNMKIVLQTDDRQIAESANRGNRAINNRYHNIIPV